MSNLVAVPSREAVEMVVEALGLLRADEVDKDVAEVESEGKVYRHVQEVVAPPKALVGEQAQHVVAQVALGQVPQHDRCAGALDPRVCTFGRCLPLLALVLVLKLPFEDVVDAELALESVDGFPVDARLVRLFRQLSIPAPGPAALAKASLQPPLRLRRRGAPPRCGAAAEGLPRGGRGAGLGRSARLLLLASAGVAAGVAAEAAAGPAPGAPAGALARPAAVAAAGVAAGAAMAGSAAVVLALAAAGGATPSAVGTDHAPAGRAPLADVCTRTWASASPLAALALAVGPSLPTQWLPSRGSAPQARPGGAVRPVRPGRTRAHLGPRRALLPHCRVPGVKRPLL
mmetsp:Transcript_92378/g.257337  ORF Transcript_92378/g.257337 Transcript_92378/m.257337 type:complete len:344 (-) Transcript_92378:364-1395(-)